MHVSLPSPACSFLFCELIILATASNITIHKQPVPYWQPPKATDTNNLTFAIHGSGTDGKIYNSSFTPWNQYGVYNYCNMPHVRPSEYIKPSTAYELVYVEVIQRHHKRTPYLSNTYPHEDIPWDCSNTEEYSYARLFGKDGIDGMMVHKEIYQDYSNPLKVTGYAGNCNFPQITAGGLQDAFDHGKDLFNVYSSMLHLLPMVYNATEIWYQVTTNEITSQVAGAVIKGMYPDKQDIKVYQERPEIDTLEPRYPCPYADEIRNAQTTDEEGSWQEHSRLTQSLFKELDIISGVSSKSQDWHSSFDHYFDSLTSRTCHSLPPPCSLTKSSHCITPTQAHRIFRLGQYEYSLLYRSLPSSLTYASTHYGLFFTSLISRLSTESAIKYRHNIAHDGSLSSVLSFLQVDEMVWPGMGAEVIFEIWRKKSDGDGKNVGLGDRRYLRALWGGQVLVSSYFGKMDMVPLHKFVEYVNSVVGKDGNAVIDKCDMQL